jgi:ABC-type molybdenum transport system ATPase subunit/photorepair protein PhrA
MVKKESNMKELFLIRGISGAGKSTLAKILVGDKDYCHKEADMYFIDRVGNYNFNPSQLKDAHKWCQDEIEFVMKYDHSPVVVSNTFTQEWEMQSYYELAEKYGYRVHSLIVENRHGGVNEHGVPEDKLEIMKNRFEVKL